MHKIIEQDLQEIISEFQENLPGLTEKTILITGGSGSIASYLVDIFERFGCKLIILSRNKIKEDYAQNLADDSLFHELSNKERSAYVQLKINSGDFMEMAKTEIETIVSMATIKMRQ